MYLQKKHETQINPAKLAIVTETKGGIALTINELANNKIFNPTNIAVYTQASHLSVLNPGDEVLFLTTEKGAFIIARSLKKKEKPALFFQQTSKSCEIKIGTAKIRLNQNGEILLQNKTSKINLSANGDVTINGKEIIQNSEYDINLQAKKNIHLN